MHLGSVDGRKNVQKGGTKQTDGICRTSLCHNKFAIQRTVVSFYPFNTPEKYFGSPEKSPV